MADVTKAGDLQKKGKPYWILGCVLAILIFCSFRVWSFVEDRRSRFPVYPDSFSEFCVVVPLGALIATLHKAFQKVMLPIARCVVEKQGKPQNVYDIKLARFGSATFKLIFVSTLSYLTFENFLKSAEWMPRELFGQGDVKACWGHGHILDSMAPITTAGTRFYQTAFAYHLSELALQIVFEPGKPDYVEMFIHHITTIFLIYVSFISNLARIGSLVLFLHYVSDIPVYGAKIFVDTKLKICTASCLAMMLAGWGYLRLYVFPFVIIRSTFYDTDEDMSVYGRDYGDLGFNLWITCNAALGSLVCLHAYWYTLFLKMGYTYATKGKTVDKQANLDKLDKNGEANAKED